MRHCHLFHPVVKKIPSTFYKLKNLSLTLNTLFTGQDWRLIYFQSYRNLQKKKEKRSIFLLEIS